MEKEIKDYLSSTSNSLNGQLRGAINKKAREINLEFIVLTINNVFETGYNLGKSVKDQEETLNKLKEDLGIKPKDNGKSKDTSTSSTG